MDFCSKVREIVVIELNRYKKYYNFNIKLNHFEPFSKYGLDNACEFEKMVGSTINFKIII